MIQITAILQEIWKATFRVIDTVYVPGGTGIRQDISTSAWHCLGSSETPRSSARHQHSIRSSCWCSQIWTAVAAVSGGQAPLSLSPAPHPATRALIMTLIIIIIGIQPLGRSGQRPELSQATGMALVRCILGKFLGVACHCFPPYVYYIKISVNLQINFIVSTH